MLCECIYIYRLQNKLYEEEDTYYILLNILRSPEMVKALTGTIDKTREKEAKDKKDLIEKSKKIKQE